MEQKLNNPPAFPSDQTWINKRDDSLEGEKYEGMTLRDYFAAKALQAIITKMPAVDTQGDLGRKVKFEELDDTKKLFAFSAYKYADAMLAERSK